MNIKFRSASPNPELDALLSLIECEIVPRKGETAVIGSKMLEVVGIVRNFDTGNVEVYLTDWSQTENDETDFINQQ